MRVGGADYVQGKEIHYSTEKESGTIVKRDVNTQGGEGGAIGPSTLG